MKVGIEMGVKSNSVHIKTFVHVFDDGRHYFYTILICQMPKCKSSEEYYSSALKRHSGCHEWKTESPMENLIVGIIACLLFGYLLVVVLRPEKF